MLVDERDDAGAARQFLSGLHVRLPVASDPDGSIGARYRVAGFPATIFVRADGSIASSRLGQLDESTLEEMRAWPLSASWPSCSCANAAWLPVCSASPTWVLYPISQVLVFYWRTDAETPVVLLGLKQAQLTALFVLIVVVPVFVPVWWRAHRPSGGAPSAAAMGGTSR